ncbi:MAG: PLP-dependent transferase, partial [Fibrobacteres bacterium]|nr:PLP-dependent transferase [Fibrobacterota bacterium]
LERTIAELEEGYGAAAFSSGMAAITAVAGLLSSGDSILLSDDLYGGTYRLFTAYFSRYGVICHYADASDSEKFLTKAKLIGCKALFIESPTNPLMKIADIRAIAKGAKEIGSLLIVDNTLMSPVLQKPITLGADIVVHSGTKFLSGHNDVVCGFVISATKELSDKINWIQNASGAILGPMDSWLVIRGLKTLGLRIERSQSNARIIAENLKKHPHVKEVLYPGSGALLSFRVTKAERIPQILSSFGLFSFAESLGGVESLVTYPWTQTHADIPEDVRRSVGVTEDLLRVSVGIEDIDDLIADLNRAIGADIGFQI